MTKNRHTGKAAQSRTTGVHRKPHQSAPQGARFKLPDGIRDKMLQVLEQPWMRHELAAEHAARVMEREGLQAHRAYKQLIQGAKRSKKKSAGNRIDEKSATATLQFAQLLYEMDPNAPDPAPEPIQQEKPLIDTLEKTHVPEVMPDISTPPPGTAPVAIQSLIDTMDRSPQQPKQITRTPPIEQQRITQPTPIVAESETTSPGYTPSHLQSQDFTHPGYRLVEGETAFDAYHKGAVIVSGHGAELHIEEHTEPSERSKKSGRHTDEKKDAAPKKSKKK